MLIWLINGAPITIVVSSLATIVVAITVHEFAHALTADWLGDPTPRSQGRLTLDPRRHLDPFGTIMIIVAWFGWGKPVYTDPRYFRTDARTGMALVAAAGPLSNLLLAYLASFPYRLGLMSHESLSYSVASLFIYLNVTLIVFNLLPVAPLDGYRVAVGLLPHEWAVNVARFERQGPLLLMLLIMSGSMFNFNFLGMIIDPPREILINMLLPVPT